MSSRALIAIGAGLLCSCFPPLERALVDPGLPPEVDRVAVLGVDRAGGLVSATGIAVRAPGEPFLVLAEQSAEVDHFLVLGWESARLPAADAGTMLTARLRRADATEPILPAPDHGRVFSRDGRAAEGAPPDWELTADWLPRCPEVVGDRAVFLDADCSVRPCAGSVREEGCVLTIDSGDCALGQLRVQVSARGALSFETTPSLSECVLDVSSPARLAFACTVTSSRRCHVRVLDDDPRPAFAVQGVQLAEPISIDLSTERGGTGLFAGMAALPDAIVVAQHGPHSSDWFNCPPAGSSRFTFLDPDDLSVVRTATAPDCLKRIVADPREGSRGFFGLYGAPPRSIGRFREDGRMLDSVAIDTPRIQPDHWVSVMAAVVEPPRIVLVVSEEGKDTVEQRLDAFLVTIDAEAPEVQVASEYFSSPAGPFVPVVVGAPLDGSRFVTVDSGTPEVMRTHDLSSLATPPIVAAFGSVCFDRGRASPASILRHTETSVTLFGGSGVDVASILTLRDREPSCGAANFPGFWANVFAIAPWPADPALAIAGLTSPEENRRSAIALVDPTTPRFLPGFVEVEPGVLGYPAVDRNGNVWLASSTRGIVYRISPLR